MNDNRSIDAIFCAAIEIESQSDRQAWLSQACGEDAELRHQVDRLLEAHFRGGSIVDSPAHAIDATVNQLHAEHPGMQIGPYKLIEPIGEGGMGTVYMAEQTQPVQRKVALKIIKPGMDSRQLVARFEAERQALSMMDHVNIARVFDGGAIETGRPYFVMELVHGVPITKYCDDNHLTPRERLELFVPVCQAIQHAHQKGIIHRDIKPSNVMVTLYDGKPVPKVIDFGVAKAIAQKLTERTLFTQFGTMVGTLEYMSPEQAEMSALGVDTRSDIYSLGVLLYELLTGSTPLRQKTMKEAPFGEILRIIKEEDPPKPSTRLCDSAETLPSISAQRNTEPTKLTKLVRGELDWIVMKALEKDRNRRYETANGFAMDLQRYLADEPVQACPPSVAYRFRKFSRRNKRALAAAAAFAGLLIVATAVSIGLAAWALQEEAATRQALEKVTGEEQKTRAALERETAARLRTRKALTRFSNHFIEETLARQVQLTEPDKQYLRDILKDYESLAAEKSDSEEADALRAEGLYRVGYIRSQLGELSDAESAYRAALEILTRLSTDFPNEPDYRRDLANVHYNLGLVLQKTSRLQEAETTYRVAVDIRTALATEFPTVLEYQQERARNLAMIGDLLQLTESPDQAETAIREALAVRVKLAADYPNVDANWAALGRSHLQLGRLLRTTGRCDAAEVAVRDALAIQTKLASAAHALPQNQHDLAECQNTLGFLCWDRRKPQDALDAFNAAFRIRSRLAADFPTVPDYRANLAGSYHNLAMHLQKNRQYKEAEQAYHAALSIRAALALQFPDVLDYREGQAISYLNLGLLFEKTDRLTAAEATYQDGLAIGRKLVEESPDQHVLHNLLAGTLVNLASLKSTQQDYPAALQFLEEARPHHEAALRALPKHPDYVQFWRNNRVRCCQVLIALGDHARMVTTARELAAVGHHRANDTYTAAGFVARGSELARANEQTELAQQYVDQAMALLQQAVAHGYNNAAQLKTNPNFAPLRMREDFQKLVAELEAAKK